MDTTQSLIEESRNLSNLAKQIQNQDFDERERKNKLKELDEIYHDWYRRSLALLALHNRPDIKQAFAKEYNPPGAFSFHKIQKFLKLGWKTHRTAKWVARYDSAFQEPLENQCNLLASLGEPLANSPIATESQVLNYITRGNQEDYSIELYQMITEVFDEGELKTLCFHLHIDYDILPGDGKANKVRELINYLKRRNRIPELISYGRQERPHADWPSLKSQGEGNLPDDNASVSSRYFLISFAQIANATISEKYRNPPITEKISLLSVPFQINSGRSIYDSAIRLREGKNLIAIKIEDDIAHLRSLYILINSGGSHKDYEGATIGRVQMVFKDGTVQETRLILGNNIREWAPGNLPSLVDQVQSPSTIEVWQGTNTSGNKAVIDRLEIPIFQQNRHRELDQIMIFHDMGTEIPALLVFAATAEITT